MASASSSSSSFFLKSRDRDEVFIQFFGEDIRKNFISHLSSALLQAGVKPSFLAERMNPRLILPSIRGFQIGIVVITKVYSETARCLQELVKIIECHETHGLMVMPVFYDINPSDVPHLNTEMPLFYEIDRSDVRDQLPQIQKPLSIRNIFSGKHQKTWPPMWSRAITKAANLPTWWGGSKHR